MSEPADKNSVSGALQLLVLIALTLLVPFGIRPLNARYGAHAPSSYLPALEGPRVRVPFDRDPIQQLEEIDPGIVVIGDSMAGTRIDDGRLGELSGVPVAPLLQAGSGSGVLVSRAQELGDRQRHQAAGGLHLLPRHQPDRRDVPARRAVPLVVDMVAGDREDELNAVDRVAAPGALRYRACTSGRRSSIGPTARGAGWSRRCRLAWAARLMPEPPAARPRSCAA